MIFFKKQEDFLGLDLSEASVKIVQLKHQGPERKPLLVTYGALSLPAHLEAKTPQALEIIAQTIQETTKRAKTTTNKVVIGLPGSLVFTTIIKLPPMTKEELPEAIKWQARHYAPLPFEETHLDWQILSRQEKETEILIMAAPEDLVARYLEILKRAELKPLKIDLEPLALKRSLLGDDLSPNIILDFGASGTDIHLFDQGVIRLSRHLPFGGNFITEELSQLVEVNPQKAEIFKRKYGMDPQKLHGYIPKFLRSIADNLIAEIRRSIEIYQNQNLTKFSRLICTGGSILLPGFLDYLKKNLEIEVILGNAWSEVDYPPELEEKLSEINPLFSVAIGLALWPGKK